MGVRASLHNVSVCMSLPTVAVQCAPWANGRNRNTTYEHFNEMGYRGGKPAYARHITIIITPFKFESGAIKLRK